MEAGVSNIAGSDCKMCPPSSSVSSGPALSSPSSSTISSPSSAWISRISSLPQTSLSDAVMPPTIISTTPRGDCPRWQMTIPTQCVRGQVVPYHKNQSTPVSMDVILSIYRELVQLINKLPFKQRLVVCIVFRGSKFRLDLGEVRAAGVACLIGLGFSLGTLLLYRLYFRIVVPFLNSVWRDRGREYLDDEYTLYLEKSESDVDEKMGNSNSKKNSTPSVYYAPGYGVSLGARPPSLNLDRDGDIKLHDEGVRLRPRKLQGRHKSPSPASDRDSAIGGVTGSEMSQSMISDNSAALRDSFYSTCTAESGYDDIMVYFEKENFCSVRERNINQLYRAHHGQDQGLNSIGRSVKPGLDTLSDASSEHSGIIVNGRSRHSSGTGGSEASSVLKTNVDPFVERYSSEQKFNSGAITPTNQRPDTRTSFAAANTAEKGNSSKSSSSPHVLSTHSSPHHRHLTQKKDNWRSPLSDVQNFNPSGHQNNSYQHQESYDPSLDASESIRSLNFSADEINWDTELGDEHKSALPELPEQSLSDLQFQQSLMQRIHEWSTFAEEYNRSVSPPPDTSSLRFVRRSQSLDRHLGDPSAVLVSDDKNVSSVNKPEIEPTTEKNLETLEYELQDIQGEFESITSKLHELIEHGNAKSTPKSSESSPHHQRHPRASLSSPFPLNSPSLLRRMRTKWDHVPGSNCSESGRSSRASSVEYAWDLADYANNSSSNTGEQSHHEMSLDAGNTSHLGSEVRNIGLPVAISDYSEEEWKGSTEKANAISEGYSRIPPLLSCQRMCVVRGDNYCGLRSTLFQVLVNGERVTRHWAGIIPVMDSLHSMYANAQTQLSNWTFANRLPDHCQDKLASLSKCALSLYATVEEVCNLSSREEREKRTIGLFNSGSTFDIELMEGLKLMMLLKLTDMNRMIEIGEDVPVFGHLLFARDTSDTVAAFLANHLNAVGDTGGLEQVEMCLLGYTLGVRIRVLRLSQCGQQDFDCVFPEDVPLDWPEIRLIAEDDRHYNVPLP